MVVRVISPGPEGWTAAGWGAAPLGVVGRVTGTAGPARLLMLFGVGWAGLLLVVALVARRVDDIE